MNKKKSIKSKDQKKENYTSVTNFRCAIMCNEIEGLICRYLASVKMPIHTNGVQHESYNQMGIASKPNAKREILLSYF